MAGVRHGVCAGGGEGRLGPAGRLSQESQTWMST